MGVKLKHNANRRMIEGKRVVLVDNSIVRGTTSQKIVQMVREAGAKEVHMRIASPPTRSSCFYGVDTPETSKLLASRMSVEEMAEFIRVDSLGFLSIDGLYRAVGEAKPRQRPAAILRRLLHRAVSDPAARPRRRGQRPHAVDAGDRRAVAPGEPTASSANRAAAVRFPASRSNPCGSPASRPGRGRPRKAVPPGR